MDQQRWWCNGVALQQWENNWFSTGSSEPALEPFHWLEPLIKWMQFISSPFPADHRRCQQHHDASAHYSHDHSKHDEPRRRGGVHRRRQRRDDTDELQSTVTQQEGTVDAVPGLPVGKVKKKQSDYRRLWNRTAIVKVFDIPPDEGLHTARRLFFCCLTRIPFLNYICTDLHRFPKQERERFEILVYTEGIL